MPTIEELSRTSLFKSPFNESSPSDWEIALLFLKSDNIKKSLPYLKKSMQSFLNDKNFPFYYSSYSLLLQVLYELGEKAVAQELHKEFQEVEQNQSLSENKTSALVVQAYYNIYFEEKPEETKELLSKALNLSFESYNKHIQTGNHLKQTEVRRKMITCLFVYSIYYLETKDYEKAEKEIKNIKLLLTDYLNLKEEVELKLSRTNNSQELQAYNQILEEIKKYSYYIQNIHFCLKYMEALIELNCRNNHIRAEKLLWELYEEVNKMNHPFIISYILIAMSRCYIKMENKKQAIIFFNLAQKRANPERKSLIVYLDQFKQQEFQKIEQAENYDLIFDTKNHLIVEKQKGCIELKNQFILMDLLNLFVLNPGIPYSKEQIIQKVWKQDYLPETHDNKIYVTIKRLREMIEVDSCRPRYICRNTSGYHFSKQAKVLVRK